MMFLAMFAPIGMMVSAMLTDLLALGAMYPLAIAMVVSVTMLAAATVALIMDTSRALPARASQHPLHA